MELWKRISHWMDQLQHGHPLLSCQSGMGALVVLGQACFSATRR